MGSCLGKKAKVESNSTNGTSIKSESKMLEKSAKRKSVAPISTEQFILLNFTAYDYDYDYDATVINNDTNIDDELNDNVRPADREEDNSSNPNEVTKDKPRSAIGINMGDTSHRTGVHEEEYDEAEGTILQSQVYGNSGLMNGQLSAINKPSLMILRKMGDTTNTAITTSSSATSDTVVPSSPFSFGSRTVQITDFNS